MYALGVDVGSVSTDMVLLDNSGRIVDKVYLRTRGNPMAAVKKGLEEFNNKYDGKQIHAVGTTGSGRMIAGIQVGADIVKNEITAHSVAALHMEPDAGTIIEIGGQDSKIIIIRDGVVIDFAMNTVCAAGTGSFLDRQAERLGIAIEDFGNHALQSKVPVRIAGRCAVFAESDMIHKQQLGYCREDIIYGLCEALTRNYMNNVGKGKGIRAKIIFQGGVAANKGIKKAFEELLKQPLHVPEHYDVMGAIGAAILAQESLIRKKEKSRFKGFEILDAEFSSKSFICPHCTNQCEVVTILEDDKEVGFFGDRCGRYQLKKNML